MRILSSLLLLAGPAFAQLPLPNPAWMPPDASAGAVPSSGGSPNPQWSVLLGDLIYFYDIQRSGKLPETNRVPWRNDSALTDGQDVGLDLTGGYYDAGDYLKCTFPLSFTLMSICWGAMDYGEGKIWTIYNDGIVGAELGVGYNEANQTPYLDSLIRWGLDWLMKAHPEDNTLFVQIDEFTADNNYWGGDQGIPEPRPSYQINSTSPGTDAAAGTAAAFAACYCLYQGKGFSDTYPGMASLQDTAYAATLLKHAQALYNFATTAPGTLYQTSVPDAGLAYPSSGWGDELSIAALFLSWATNDASLHQAASSYYSQYSLANYQDAYNWDTKTPGIPVLFAQIANAQPSFGDMATWQSQAEAYFDSLVYGGRLATKTPGGLLYFPDDSPEASINPALNTAMLLYRYSPLASTSQKQQDYFSFAKDQVDYVLGKNPMNAPYVVGVNPNSPQNPSSPMASGGNDAGNVNNDPPVEAHVLYGGVIGGPTQNDLYYDIRDDWPESEAALDYNAPMLTIAAMHVLNDTSDPFYTSLQAGAYQSKKPTGTPCDEVYSCSGGSS